MRLVGSVESHQYLPHIGNILLLRLLRVINRYIVLCFVFIVSTVGKAFKEIAKLTKEKSANPYENKSKVFEISFVNSRMCWK